MELKRLFIKIYEDNAKGKLNDERFELMSQNYEAEQKQLEAEVITLKQEIEVKQEQEVQIEINLSSYIPDSYIEDSSQKIEIYQDIALCRTNKDIEDVIDEIIDRYGSMPKEVENLIEIARIKILARKAAVIKVTQKEKSIVLNLDRENIKVDENTVKALVSKYGLDLRFSAGVEPYITLRVNSKDEKEIIEKIKEMLITIGSSENIAK